MSDELWAMIAYLLPAERPKLKGGPPCIPDRTDLTGMLFVLTSGIRLRSAALGDGLRLNRSHQFIADTKFTHAASLLPVLLGAVRVVTSLRRYLDTVGCLFYNG